MGWRRSSSASWPASLPQSRRSHSMLEAAMDRPFAWSLLAPAVTVPLTYAVETVSDACTAPPLDSGLPVGDYVCPPLAVVSWYVPGLLNLGTAYWLRNSDPHVVRSAKVATL